MKNLKRFRVAPRSKHNLIEFTIDHVFPAGQWLPVYCHKIQDQQCNLNCMGAEIDGINVEYDVDTKKTYYTICVFLNCTIRDKTVVMLEPGPWTDTKGGECEK